MGDSKVLKFGHFIPIREAVGTGVDEAARTARVVIITEGLGNLKDKNYYTKGAVSSCSEVFNGKQFYLDHPSETEEQDRPERSVRDLAGYFYDTQPGNVKDPDTGEDLSACFATLRFADSEPGRLAFDQVRTALEYQKRFPSTKDTYAGISINGGGMSHTGRIDGMEVNMVEEIKEAFSADIVTKPARGGKFVSLMKEAEALTEWKTRKHSGPTRVGGTDKGEKVAKVKKAKEAGDVQVIPADGQEMPADGQEMPEEVPVGDRMKGLAGKLDRLTAAVNEPPEDPEDLITDIQQDLDALNELLDTLKDQSTQAEAEAKARRKEAKMAKQDEAKKTAEAEDEAKKKAAEAEAKKTSETEGEDEEAKKKAAEAEGEAKKASETEDDEDEQESESEDEGMYGMRSDEEEAYMGETGPRMRYACASCSEENEVMAPKGYRLMKMDEMAASESGSLASAVTRLRRTLESKEHRFVQANKEKRDLLQENIKLRAKLTAYERMVEAKRLLKESGVARDILSPADLLAFEPHQWGSQIKAAKRVADQETKLINRGGVAERGEVGNPKVASGDDAIASFNEAYKSNKR